MPRLPRIDIEGVLQHVMIRGIEKRDIFIDNRDRFDFLERFSRLLLKTNTECLAWSLLSNHAHALLRPRRGNGSLSELMQRLLTGYAVAFNLRHHRCGRLFQNRYKSIVCEEDSYLLELIRYIHLNPIRAGLVPSIRKLDTYKWSGHAGLMGCALLPGQVIGDVLLQFDDDEKKARKKYHDFVTDGIALGRRNELVGGGLKRRMTLSGPHDYEPYDERILGSGDFVEEVWQETENPQPDPQIPPSLEEIIEQVSAFWGIPADSVRQGSKQRQISNTRGVVCFIAVRVFGYTGADLTKHIKLSESGVVLAARRGEVLWKRTSGLLELFNHPSTQSNPE